MVSMLSTWFIPFIVVSFFNFSRPSLFRIFKRQEDVHMPTVTGKRRPPPLAIDGPGWTVFPQTNAEGLSADSSMSEQGRADNH